MLYLVNLFKHNWIYYALSICISALAAFESVRFLLLLGLLVGFCLFKGIWKMHVLFIALIGALSFCYFSVEVKKLEEPISVPGTFTWTDEYKINGTMLRGFMKNESGEKVYVTYQLKSEQEKAYYSSQQLAGTRFIVDGEQVEPSIPAHRYGFSMKRYLQSKNARGIIEVSTLQLIDQPFSIFQLLFNQRFQIKQHIEQTFPPSLVAEAQSLLIGLQENVDEELNRAYQKLGITHLFAISGLHVALVSVLFFQALLRIGMRREMANLLLLIVLPMYAILAGGAPSIWRAVSVVEFIMLAQYLRWKIPMDDALSLSFILFVLFEPGVIFQVGFQLSYLATYSLVYSGRILSRFSNWWMQSFLITFVCQLLVYPLLLFHFFEISLSSFIANIFFVPLFSFVILPINLILLFLTYLPFRLDAFVFALYEPVRTLLTKGIMLIQQPIVQMWNPGKPTLFWLIVLYISVFITLYLLDVRARFQKVLASLLIPAIFFHLHVYLHKDLHITFVNVGQGDCIVIELPYRRQVLVIDAGGLLRFEQEKWKERQQPYEVGRQIVLPYLKGRGIQTVDTFILTHADADHVEGAEEILKEIRVKEVHVTPNSLDKTVMTDFLAELNKTKTILKERMVGHNWQVGDVSFSYLWPSDTEYEGNNDSLVLLLQQNQFKAVFTGDLEKEGELELVKQYPALLQNIDLLKAGHHGSKTSSSEEFVSLTNPRYVIFMAGENNRYLHPHIDVVNRFEQRNIPYATTGYDGTVEIRVQGQMMLIEKSNELYTK